GGSGGRESDSEEGSPPLLGPDDLDVGDALATKPAGDQIRLGLVRCRTYLDDILRGGRGSGRTFLGGGPRRHLRFTTLLIRSSGSFRAGFRRCGPLRRFSDVSAARLRQRRNLCSRS